MSKKCFIMGFPGAGKTTFLAAFWHSITAMSSQPRKLKIKNVNNEQYLASLSLKWANAEQLERTMPEVEKTSILVNLETQDGIAFNLQVPDLSGETFQRIYEDREISTDVAEYIRNADAILFFINVESIKKDDLIPEVFQPDTVAQPSVERRPRIPREDDAQVHVVELIQFVMHLREGAPVTVSFVLSAWDLVNELPNAITPIMLFKQHMPLLHQLCESNSDRIIWNVWGISAQGGELDAAEKLLEKDTPIERIMVISFDGASGCDITLPVFDLVGDCE